MKFLCLACALFCVSLSSAEIERLIDRPITIEEFEERKENLIGARVAVAAYYFQHLEGSWMVPDKKKPYEGILSIRADVSTSCFTKEGKKVFEFQLSQKGFPCLAYGVVKSTKGRCHIELDSIYEVSSDDPDWLSAQKKE